MVENITEHVGEPNKADYNLYKFNLELDRLKKEENMEGILVLANKGREFAGNCFTDNIKSWLESEKETFSHTRGFYDLLAYIYGEDYKTVFSQFVSNDSWQDFRICAQSILTHLNLSGLGDLEYKKFISEYARNNVKIKKYADKLDEESRRKLGLIKDTETETPETFEFEEYTALEFVGERKAITPEKKDAYPFALLFMGFSSFALVKLSNGIFHNRSVFFTALLNIVFIAFTLAMIVFIRSENRRDGQAKFSIKAITALLILLASVNLTVAGSHFAKPNNFMVKIYKSLYSIADLKIEIIVTNIKATGGSESRNIAYGTDGLGISENEKLSMEIKTYDECVVFAKLNGKEKRLKGAFLEILWDDLREGANSLTITAQERNNAENFKELKFTIWKNVNIKK